MTAKPDKLIFFDLDGTLLNQESLVAPSTLTAITKLKANNIIPVIATGRSNAEITKVQKATKIDNVITMNGHYCRFNQKVILNEKINMELCYQIKEVADSLRLPLIIENEKLSAATFINKDVEVQCDKLNTPVPAPNIEALFSDSVNMMVLFCNDTRLDSYLAESFPKLSFIRASSRTIDINLSYISKGYAVTKLKDYVNGAFTTYAFGDSLNDIKMFQACDYSIAMGNAKAELKKYADFHTESNEKDGVYKGLQMLELI